jgi:DNA polymerase-3 subunit epsilon
MKFIAFDTETTGFLPGVDQIIEIGAVRFEGGEPVDSFTTLIDPGQRIPDAVVKITGITEEMVFGKPPLEELLEPFTEFCGDDLLVAHNASFDFHFLLDAYKKFEISGPTGAVLDTCSMARKVFPGLLNYKLGTLVQHLKIKSEGFHRAQADSIYCGQLFWEMIKKISVNGQLPAFENLVALSNNTALRFPKIEKTAKQLNLLDSLGI